MITCLFIIFLVLSIWSSGIAVIYEAKSAMHGAVASGAAITERTTGIALNTALNPAESMSRTAKNLQTNKVLGLKRRLAKLKRTKQRTPIIRQIRRQKLHAKIGVTRGRLVVNNTKLIGNRAAHLTMLIAKRTTQAVNTTAKITKNTNKLLKGTSNLIAKANRGLANIYNVLSEACASLMPIDWIITLIILIIVVFYLLIGSILITVLGATVYVSENGEETYIQSANKTQESEAESVSSDLAPFDANDETLFRNMKDDTGYYQIYQTDPRWGDVQWNTTDTTIGNSACGATCLTMAMATYLDKPISMAEVDSKLDEQFPNERRTNLTYHDDIGTGVANDGFNNILKCYPECADIKLRHLTGFAEVDDVLAQGNCVMVCVHGRGRGCTCGLHPLYNNKEVWSNGGHYILIVGGNATDGYRVHDPAGNCISEWTPYCKHTFESIYLNNGVLYVAIEAEGGIVNKNK